MATVRSILALATRIARDQHLGAAATRQIHRLALRWPRAISYRPTARNNLSASPCQVTSEPAPSPYTVANPDLPDSPSPPTSPEAQSRRAAS